MWAMKEVKLFNGGTPRHPDYRFYVGAWSAADAVRLMMSCTRAHLDAAYLSKMWSKGAWGDTMEGIPHARGVWASSGWGTGSEKLPWHLVDCDAKVLVHASQLPDKKNYFPASDSALEQKREEIKKVWKAAEETGVAPKTLGIYTADLVATVKEHLKVLTAAERMEFFADTSSIYCQYCGTEYINSGPWRCPCGDNLNE